MAEGAFYGMQTFDQALVRLVMEGLVREEDAMEASTNAHDFSLALKSARLRETSTGPTRRRTPRRRASGRAVGPGSRPDRAALHGLTA